MSKRIEATIASTAPSSAAESNAKKDWNSWDRSIGRPTSGLIDVLYTDGKVFLNKRAEDCFWGSDSLIDSWRKAEGAPPSTQPTGRRKA